MSLNGDSSAVKSPNESGKRWVKFVDEDDGDPSTHDVGASNGENVHDQSVQLSVRDKYKSNRPTESISNKDVSTAAVVEVTSSSFSNGTNISRNLDSDGSYTNKGIHNSTNVPAVTTMSQPTRTMEHSEIAFDDSQVTRRTNSGFTNGDVIVSVLPVNTKWPWITPASFRPELVPEDLMVPGLTLTVEEYVHAMDLMTSDFRFNIYTICYKRLLASWLFIAFFILIIILFSGVVGIHLFTLGISWLVVNAAAVFFCLYIKIKINKGVEECMARVNSLFVKHNLVVGLDDRGRISCHKVHLCFIYFDPNECVNRLEALLENETEAEQHGDARRDIVITGPQRTQRIPSKQNGERLLLKYIQRWAKDFLRRRLDWTIGEGTENPSSPRHLTSALCPCQYIEEYTRHKPTRQIAKRNWFPWTLPFSFTRS